MGRLGNYKIPDFVAFAFVSLFSLKKMSGQSSMSPSLMLVSPTLLIIWFLAVSTFPIVSMLLLFRFAACARKNFLVLMLVSIVVRRRRRF
jgi:hypothetical protein